MQNSSSKIDSDPSGLATALEEYYSLQDSGHSDPRGRVLAKYPDIHDELVECLNSLDLVDSLGPGLIDSPMADQKSDGVLSQNATLGDFRLLRQIGRGGMGIVYEAEQLSLSRRIALKILPFAATLDERQLQRFKNEAKAAGLLQHPNIVPVHGVGVERGVHYYAMQLIEGVSLADLLHNIQIANGLTTRADDSHSTSLESGGDEETSREYHTAGGEETNPIAVLSTEYDHARDRYYRSIANVVRQAAVALHHAHQYGIVHRDIKPSNLLVDSNGKVWVTDFGLAIVDSDANLTLSGSLLGTARYMSPEQASGRRSVLDHRTDIYSLGITLYELLTLKPAFQGDNHAAIVRQVADEIPARPKQLSPAIPDDLETIVLKATEKDADGRYESAIELADDLKRFLDSKPITARRFSRLEVLGRWARRNPAIATLTSAVAILLITMAVAASGLSAHLATVAHESAATAERETRMRREMSVRLYVADMNRAQEELEAGDMHRCEELLMRHVPEPEARDRRGFEWFYLWDRCHRGGARHILRHGLPISSVAYSPDGGHLFTGKWLGGVFSWDAVRGTKTGELPDRKPHRRSVIGLNVSDDGDSIVSTCHDGVICTWEVSTGEVLSLIESDEQSPAWHASIAKKRQLIAVSFGTRMYSHISPLPASVVVWNLKGGGIVKRFDGMIGEPVAVFSHDNAWLAIGQSTGQVDIVDTRSWTTVRTMRSHRGPISSLAFSVDGTVLVSCSGRVHGHSSDGHIKVWKTHSWQDSGFEVQHTETARAVAFSPNGKHLVFGSDDGVIAIWDMASGLRAASFQAHAGPIKDVAWSPGAQEFSSVGGDNACRIWNIKGTLAIRSTSNPAVVQEGVVYSTALADNDQIICLAPVISDLIQVREIRTGKVRFSIELPGSTTTDVAVSPSPDNQVLAAFGGSYPIDKDHPPDLGLYRLADGERLLSLDVGGSHTARIAFTPSGKELVGVCFKHVRTWDTSTGQQLGEFGPLGHWIKAVRPHPNKRLVACGANDGFTYFLSLPDLQLINKEKTNDGVIETIDFSPDGRRFLTAGRDRRIRLWNTETLELEREFKPISNWIMHARFSPDGRRILSTGIDGHLRIWEPTVGEEVLRLPVEPSWIMNGEFSADGSKIIAACQSLHVWKAADRWKELQRLSGDQLRAICLE